MQIGKRSEAATAIAASNRQGVVVRGRDLAGELIGNASLTQMLGLLVTGQMLDSGQERVLDAAMVAIAEHGLVPSVQAARMTLAAAPEALQGAVAAGILGCGSVIVGSAEFAAIMLKEIMASEAANPAQEVVANYRNARRPFPGFGHPEHKDGDPRALRLLEVAREESRAGPAVAALHAAAAVLPDIYGRSLPLNVSGAIAAVLLDIGLSPTAIKGAVLMARTASLIAHLVEEQARPIGFALSAAGSAAIRYDGISPEGFVPA